MYALQRGGAAAATASAGAKNASALRLSLSRVAVSRRALCLARLQSSAAVATQASRRGRARLVGGSGGGVEVGVRRRSGAGSGRGRGGDGGPAAAATTLAWSHRAREMVGSWAAPSPGSGSRSGVGVGVGAAVVDAALSMRESLEAQQQIWAQKIPKGFDNFFPKGGGSGGDSAPKDGKAFPDLGGKKADAGASSSAGKDAGNASSKASGQESTGGPGGGGGPGGDGERKLPGGQEMLVAAAIVAFLFSLTNDGTGASGKRPVEITWQDFTTLLLESGKVERIVVANHTTAKVIMKEPIDLRSMADGSNVIGGGGGAGDMMSSRSEDGGRGRSGGGYDGAGGGDWSKGGGDGGWAAGGKSDDPKHMREGLNLPSYQFEIGSVDTFERKLEESQRQMGISPRDFIPVQYVTESSRSQGLIRALTGLLPTLAVIGTLVYLSRGSRGGAGGGAGGIGRVFKMMDSKATRVKPDSVKVTFKDVAGVDEAKKEIMEFVEFLKTPEKFTNLGAKIPKGALLSGPPGTGKTLLAKATAGEAKVPFFTVSGSDFIEMFVGVGPGRVRDLFKEARKNAPCIVFIDEIDAVGRKRGKGQFGGGNDERENTLNQLLVEMDGFSSNTNVVVLAGTNRVDVLDPALTRPGRFDRQITVDKPDIKGRKAIFEVHLTGLNLDGKSTEFSGRLAGLTPGFVGADIENLCNEAAIVAARRDKKKIEMEDFESATDRVIGGLESNKLIMPEEKRIVAYHEAGHAVAGWNLEHADPLMKVTIVPRGASTLGYAQYLPKEVFLRTREQITDIICMALAGRASEQVHFGDVTTGASDDLRRVTAMVYQMIGVYGMGDGIGQLAFPKDDGGGGFPQERPYSDATAEKMDLEARKMVDSAYQRTLDLVEAKKEQIKLVAELLLEKETINHDDLVSLIGARPFKAHKSYLEFISANEDAKQKKADSISSKAEEDAAAEEAVAAATTKATGGGDDVGTEKASAEADKGVEAAAATKNRRAASSSGSKEEP